MLFLESLMGLVLFMVVMFFFVVMFAGIMLHPPWWYWRESHTVTIIQQQPPQPAQPPPPPSIQYHIHLNQVDQQLPAPQPLLEPAHRPVRETLEGEYREIGARPQAIPAPTGEDEFARILNALGAPRGQRQLPHSTPRQLPHRRG